MGSDMADENKAWVSLTTVIILGILAIFVVALRFYTRTVLAKTVGIDDYTVLVALLFTLVEGGTVIGSIPVGLGRHITTLPASSIAEYLRIFYWTIVFYTSGLTLIKLAFIFQYYRLVGVSSMKRVIWITGTIITLWSMSQVFIGIFTCNPIKRFWDRTLPGTCMPNLPQWYINAAGNIVTDISIMIMPLPILSKLQMPSKQKYFLIAIFSLGIFTTAISLLRLRSLDQGPDFTFTGVPTASWSFAELTCGIICVCLPTLRPFVSRFKPQWMELSRRSRVRASGLIKLGGGNSNEAHGGDQAVRGHDDGVPLRSGAGSSSTGGRLGSGDHGETGLAKPSAAQTKEYEWRDSGEA